MENDLLFKVIVIGSVLIVGALIYGYTQDAFTFAAEKTSSEVF